MVEVRWMLLLSHITCYICRASLGGGQQLGEAGQGVGKGGAVPSDGNLGKLLRTGCVSAQRSKAEAETAVQGIS